MKYLRIIAGIIIGLFVGAIFIYGFQALSQIFFPPPYEYDPANPEIFRKLPSKEANFILLLLLISNMIGSLAGGFIAGIISKGKNVVASLLTGVFLMSYGLIYLSQFYHPLWFWIFSLTTYILFAWFGGLLAGWAKKT